MDCHELISAIGAKLGVELELEDGLCAPEADGMRVTIHDLPELAAMAFAGDACKHCIDFGENPSKDTLFRISRSRNRQVPTPDKGEGIQRYAGDVFLCMIPRRKG